MKKILISLKNQYIYSISWNFFCICLSFFFYGCSNQGLKYKYNYISDQQQRVLEVCALVFTNPYYQYISPSRKVRLIKISVTSWGFWANFDDGRAYRVPIHTGLTLGEEYYCSFNRKPNYCPRLNNLNFECEWD